jgi:hypothetical protein
MATYQEQLAYKRGYNRARARFAARAWQAVKIAKLYRQQLATAASDRRCDGCDRWTRGGKRCLWGRCRGDFEFGAEPRMWADSFAGEHEQRSVITTEDFGCVNWLPKNGA